MDNDRKRPRPTTPNTPTILHLQNEISTLRTQLTHAQSMRSLDRKSYTLENDRLKRQVADVLTEIEQRREICNDMRVEMEGMERQIGLLVERVRAGGGGGAAGVMSPPDDGEEVELEREKCNLLQRRLDATTNQVEELTKLLQQAQEATAAAELKASNAELKLSQFQLEKQHEPPAVNDENCNPQILRATRIQLAETERKNRELTRQNDEMKVRLKDMVACKEKAGSAQRRIVELEREVKELQHRVQSGEEVERKWMNVKKELVEEGLVDGDDDDMNMDVEVTPLTMGIPPEIATVVRKFQGLKMNVKRLKEENERLGAVSDERSRRCAQFEQQLKDKNNTISLLEKEVKTAKETMSHLELENKKIVAQQAIWKRESESMRSLLDTYELQETNASSNRSKLTKPESEASPSIKGLQLSLQSSQDEIKLLSETNSRLQYEIDSLKTQQQESQTEHERVLDKFAKLRTALMEERSKASAAEERACLAETLAGKGSYNSDTTRVVHLESNPLTIAMREKYQAEIDLLKQQLESAAGSTTPVTTRGSIGSGTSDVDAQKLHKRLKERFKEQIGLFREGVYLITGCKIDMFYSDSDCPHFKVRSIYGEREEDHLMFQWQRKKSQEDNDLDLMSTDLAQFLMNGPSAIYMTKYCSVPAFMASVTLGLFENQTMV